MAEVDKLMSLGRAELNEFATQHGVESAEDTVKYPTKRPLAEALSTLVQDDEVDAFVASKESKKNESGTKDETATETQEVTDQADETAAPKPKSRAKKAVTKPTFTEDEDDDDIEDEFKVKITADLKAKIRNRYDKGHNFQALADRFRLTTAEVEEIVVSGQAEAEAKADQA